MTAVNQCSLLQGWCLSAGPMSRITPYVMLPAPWRRRDLAGTACTQHRGPSCLRAGGGDEQPSEPGNPKLQDNLVDMLILQIGQEKVKESADQESLKLRLAAEQAKAEVDKLLDLEKSRSGLAFDSALADVNTIADQFEEELRSSRQELEADKAQLEDWEQQMYVDRSRGQFFQSLYQKDKKKPVGAKVQVVQGTPGQTSSKFVRFYIYSFLAAILGVGVTADVLSSSPSPGQDVLYVAIGTALGVTAWQERQHLVSSADKDGGQ